MACGADVTGPLSEDSVCGQQGTFTADSSWWGINVGQEHQLPGWRRTGSRTQWSPSIGVIALGADSGASNAGEEGMNISLSLPPRAERIAGDEPGVERCTATVTYAELVTADQRAGSPDEVNPRFYSTLPDRRLNCNVGSDNHSDSTVIPQIAILSIANSHIKGVVCVKMVEQVFSPTGGVTYGDEVEVRASFTATNF